MQAYQSVISSLDLLPDKRKTLFIIRDSLILCLLFEVRLSVSVAQRLTIGDWNRNASTLSVDGFARPISVSSPCAKRIKRWIKELDDNDSRLPLLRPIFVAEKTPRKTPLSEGSIYHVIEKYKLQEPLSRITPVAGFRNGPAKESLPVDCEPLRSDRLTDIAFPEMGYTPSNLREFRARHELSQTQVAQMLGVGVRAVNNWEKPIGFKGHQPQRDMPLIQWVKLVSLVEKYHDPYQPVSFDS